MTLVWEHAPYSENKLIVLLALADWSNDEGCSWPCMQRLADKARIDVRSARRIVRVLEAAGLLETEKGGGRSKQNRYTLNLLKLTRTQRPSLENPDIRNTDIGGPETRTLEADTRTLGAQTRTRVSSDPLVEPSEEPSLDPPYSGDEFKSALNSFKRHRKQIKKPLSPEAEHLLLLKLSRWPELTATRALEDAVINQWQGVFEPKDNNNGTNGANQPNGYQTNAQRGRAASFAGLLKVVDELREASSGGTDEDVRRKSLAS